MECFRKSTLTGRNEQHEDIRGHEGMIKVMRENQNIRCRDVEMETETVAEVH